MSKTIFEEMGGAYVRQGDYNLPCLSLPAEKENRLIGVWGQRHLRYLKQHRKVLYTNLLTSGKLDSYLADINEQAEDMFLRLVEQMVNREGVTEHLHPRNRFTSRFRGFVVWPAQKRHLFFRLPHSKTAGCSPYISQYRKTSQLCSL